MERCGPCTAEGGVCANAPTTSWAQTVFFSRTWRSSKHRTIRPIIWYLVASMAQSLPHTCTIWGNTYVYPSNFRRPWTGSTKTIIFDEGTTWKVDFNVGRVELFVPNTSSEPGNHPLPNLLLCSSNFADEQYLSFLVCGSYHFIVDLLFV